ncbi:MAG: GTPase ObgE, partial [Betaproteobacteria bacterium]
ARARAFVTALGWTGPVFLVSAIDGSGCRALTFAVADWLDAQPAPASEATDSGEPLVVSPAPRAPRRRIATDDTGQS